MNTYVALLRGINVSGHKLIKMADLKIHLEELKFKTIKTYIQSGNIIFETSSADTDKLAKKITQKIKEKYGFDVPVIVLSMNNLNEIIDNNKFLNNVEKPIDRIYITILDKHPTDSDINKLKSVDYTPEEFILHQNFIYLYFPEGYANAKLSTNFFEKQLKVKATTRNWKTICKVWELTGH